jgi:hypothetical protein
MIATQIQQIYYGRDFKTQEDIDFRDDIATGFVAFLKDCVDQGLIENKQSWDWDSTTQIENVYFFSKDMLTARDFQKALVDSDIYQTAFQAMKAEGYHISVGMVNFVETEDTRYDTIK